jgi:hypothetical protein
MMNVRDRAIPIFRALDWTEAMSLLSLDLSRQFFEDMGLALPRVELFQPMLRTVIEGHRDVLDTRMPLDLSPFLRASRDALIAAHGTTFLEWFDVWFEEIFRIFTPEWRAYRSALIVWQAGIRTGQPGELQLGPAANQLYSRFEELFRDPRIPLRLSAAALSAKSPWDSFLYTLRRYSDDKEAVNVANNKSDAPALLCPLEVIEDVIARNHFLLFWAELLPNLDERSSVALWHLAKTKTTFDVPRPAEMRSGFSWNIPRVT